MVCLSNIFPQKLGSWTTIALQHFLLAEHEQERGIRLSDGEGRDLKIIKPANLTQIALPDVRAMKMFKLPGSWYFSPSQWCCKGCFVFLWSYESLEQAPLPSNNHHRDYETFAVLNPNLKLTTADYPSTLGGSDPKSRVKSARRSLSRRRHWLNDLEKEMFCFAKDLRCLFQRPKQNRSFTNFDGWLLRSSTKTWSKFHGFDCFLVLFFGWILVFFVKDTSSMTRFSRSKQALGCWWTVERWNGLRVPGWRFWGLLGWGLTLRGWKNQSPPKKNEVPILEMGDTMYLEHCEIHYFGAFFGLNPLNEGSYQSKQGSLGRMYVYFHIFIFVYIFYMLHMYY